MPWGELIRSHQINFHNAPLQRCDIHTGTQFLISLLEEQGVSYILDQWGEILTIQLPWWWYRMTKWRNYWLNTSAIWGFFKNKLSCSNLLAHHGISIPQETILAKAHSTQKGKEYGLSQAYLFTSKVWYPVIIKPCNGQQWNNIFVAKDAHDLAEFHQTYSHDKEYKDIAIVQEYRRGSEYRVIYFDWDIISCYKKFPLSIIWNGSDNIATLLTQKTLCHRYEKAISEVLQQWLSPSHIPSSWTEIQIFPYINDVSDKTTKAHRSQSDVDFCQKLSHIMWSSYFWLDIITHGEIHEGCVIEINWLPGLQRASSVDPNVPHIFIKKFLQYTQKIQSTLR
jgi:RimK-like ATP-grasp domain